MGDFLAEIDAEQATHKGATCSVRAWQDANPDKVDDFKAAMSSDKPSTVILRVMKRYGYTGTANTLQRHRRGECKCHEQLR